MCSISVINKQQMMIEADSHFIVRSRLARRNEQIRSRNRKFSISSRPKVRSKHPVPLSHVGKFLARCFRCQRTLMLMLCVTNNNSPSTHASFLSATNNMICQLRPATCQRRPRLIVIQLGLMTSSPMASHARRVQPSFCAAITL